MSQTNPSDTYLLPGSQPDIFRKLNINQDPRMEELVKLHIRKSQHGGKIPGFRVEIFFSSEMNARQKAQSMKGEFLAAYPDINVYVTYVSPDFKVRVGDFKTRNEALKLMNEIQNQFPKAFVVPDIIELPKLF
jgi:hypothetical protein